MLRILSRRLATAVPLVILVSALTFVFVSAEPDNLVRKLLPTAGTTQQISQLRRQLGLDRPVYVQYWDWLSHAVRGDLGTGWVTHEPVLQTIVSGLPVTLSLVVGSVIAFLGVGVGLGVLSAVRGGFLGRAVDSVTLVAYALPGFWLGALLITVFAVKLHVLPAIGYVSFSQSPAEWARSLVLPIAALTLSSVALVAKQTREAMIDALSSEHVRMAWANGLPRRDIYFRLALKTAGGVIVTIGGLVAIALLLGTVFVEQVFAIPGLGSALVSATVNGDIPVVLGITVVFTLIIIVINLIVDLTYTALDPRVRTS
jgi:peptide/nickel transport system permease protein